MEGLEGRGNHQDSEAVGESFWDGRGVEIEAKQDDMMTWEDHVGPFLGHLGHFCGWLG